MLLATAFTAIRGQTFDCLGLLEECSVPCAGHYLYPLLQSALEPSLELEAALVKLHSDHAQHAPESMLQALDAGSFAMVPAPPPLLDSALPTAPVWSRQ